MSSRGPGPKKKTVTLFLFCFFSSQPRNPSFVYVFFFVLGPGIPGWFWVSWLVLTGPGLSGDLWAQGQIAIWTRGHLPGHLKRSSMAICTYTHVSMCPYTHSPRRPCAHKPRGPYFQESICTDAYGFFIRPPIERNPSWDS